MKAGALDGIVVVDFSRVLAGPYATMMLGDFGADVVKIERRGRVTTPGTGDRPTIRPASPRISTPSTATSDSVVLDLGDPDDLQQARDLVSRSDIVVENFRPGPMDKLGLGYDDLRRSGPTSSTARSPASAVTAVRHCRATTCSCRPSAA